MKHTWLWVAVGLLLVWTSQSGAMIQETPPDTAKPDKQDEAVQDPLSDENFDKLTADNVATKVKEQIEEYAKQRLDFAKKYREASTSGKATPNELALLRNQSPDPEKLAKWLRKVAEAFPQTDAEEDSLVWLATNRSMTDDFDFAFDMLLAHHVSSPQLPQLVMALGRQRPSPKIEERFKVIFDNPDASKELLGMAHYAYANYQNTLARIQPMLSDERIAESVKKSYGEESFQYIKDFKLPSEDEQLAELEKVVADYGDVEIREGMTLGDVLGGEIFEIKYLGIGKTAPDISGEDIDGTEFKTSDYRGKVVVIDFWGDW